MPNKVPDPATKRVAPEPTPTQPTPAQVTLAQVTPAQVTPASEPASAEPPAPADSLQLREEAKQLAEDLVKNTPNNPDALEIKARFHLLFGETEAAKQCWQNALRLAPDYAYALHGLGKIALLNSNYDEAIDLIKKSIPGQPANAECVHDLSDAYTKLGKLDESIETLRAFAEKNPRSAMTYLLLGQGHQAKEQFEQAEAAYRKVLEIAPGTPRAELGLGTVLVRLGRRDEAKPFLASQKANREAVNKNRSAEEVFRDESKECSSRFHIVSEFYLAHGDQSAAERVALRALAFHPGNLQPKALLVGLYQQQGRLKQALELTDQLRAADNQNARWPFTRGTLLSRQGDLAGARQAYADVVRLAPSSHIGYESLARLAIGSGSELNTAIEHAKKAVEIRGTAADHELLAQAYAVNADYPRAHSSLVEAIRLDPTNTHYAQAMKQLRKVMGSSE